MAAGAQTAPVANPANTANAADAANPANTEQPALSGPGTVCGQAIPPPRALPPANSGPVVYLLAPCFLAQGNVYLVEPQTYLYYIQLKASQPSQSIWVPWTDDTEKTLLEDFRRLWNTNFLDDLSIDVQDYTFANGVLGKVVTYNLEERQRVKIVDFTGSKKIDTSKIDETLRAANAAIRLDTFIDPGLIRKVEGVLRDMMKEKGFQFAGITHEIKTVAGGPKLIHLTFNVEEGPKVKIQTIDFEGNTAISDGALRRRMKENKEQWFLSFITGRGTYQETKFEEDAEKVLDHYRNLGYITAQVGEPTLNFVRDSPDKKTRYLELKIPVVEGNRYRVGKFEFAGNTVVKSELLRPLFKIQAGDYYSQEEVRKGFQKAQEMYGGGGYTEFTGYPDYVLSDQPNPADPQAPAALAAVPDKPAGPPVADVTMRITEGKQYFINRITFVGNTTTRDNVIRRELRLYENGIFNTEALKYSVRRLNQLGYFKALEGPPKDVVFEKTPGVEGKMDVKFTLEEQNRNQLSFGAGVSQFEGFFGQLSFQTANFLGRGESLTVSMQAGSRAQTFQVSFTEPFLFDRNITGGANLFKNEVRYLGQFTQSSQGGVLSFGFPLGTGFTRAFVNYSYEQTRVTELNDYYRNPVLLQQNPFLRDSLLLGQNGVRTISKVVPSIVHNTVDQPIFPTTGRRLSASVDLAGLGGNTNFYKPMGEAIWFLRQNARMSLGLRGQAEYIAGWRGTSTDALPIFERLFMGGEYSVRGFDLRSIGPSDPTTGLVLGGNKSLLFNVEQLITIAGPVRLILFYDAGQIRDTGQGFSFWEDKLNYIFPARPLLTDPFATATLTDPSVDTSVTTEVVGRQSAFKTSTGAEIRFFMPVLNVPFRLIFALNPQRAGVRDNQLQAQKAFQFRFAVGTTF
jgi:outer membrane protein insertion porin family